MTSNPFRLTSLEKAIDEAFHRRVIELAEPPREYLGASLLGRPCDRFLWLSFRHAFDEKVDGRMLRLFARGQKEEYSFCDLLRILGCDLAETLEDQSWVHLAPFIGGHPDGIILRGLPGAERTKHIVEFKTHNDRSFRELCAKGVQEAKPEHYTQMQVYCKGKGINRWLYMAVNKDTDELYCERGNFDSEFAEEAIARGEKVVMATQAPVPMNADPAYYKCKWCPANDICHGKKTIDTEHISCRTCMYSYADVDEKWHCMLFDNDVIPSPEKEYPCHVIHPDLALCWKTKSTGREGEMGYIIGSTMMVNGGSGRTTRAILSDPLLKLAGDFNGRVEDGTV